MSGETGTLNVVGQQEPAGAPPVSAATSVAEIPAPDPPAKGKADEPVRANVPDSGPGDASGENGLAPTTATDGTEATEESGALRKEPTSAPVDNNVEAAEPATLPTAPLAVETKETNGLSNPVVAEPEATAAQPDKDSSEQGRETAAALEKSTESAETTAPVTNGKSEEKDTEMKEDPATAAPFADTAKEDGLTAPVEAGTKREAGEALGPDADAGAGLPNGKKAKTADGETAAEHKAEANGGADTRAPPAKKVGRPRKQAKPAVPVGRTLRKTRSQGPIEP
ncbi:uncharacterized protein B0T15DRAFT_144072 [Chaetomium strumarium]|uniref:Uncharacterized protein n=1 Tax=Chaetomium strumarium TaxID=1170767 RepID=A0AAJ0GV32_9PEZI|nr:hypothetical protein B0T15DRAFT_144072 [Chaetomium strumarium]